ncbi:MAG TPA: Trm112 family protein [Desulfobulbus sp.]|nr:Trm112 family protein [Desulfobulbus sp.]
MKQELLDILACPKCKGPIQLNTEKNGLICLSCKLVFPVRNDIPIMLIDEAKPLDTTNHPEG